MQQFDFIGGRSPEAADRQKRQIANTRPTVAEEKARLCLEIGRLAMKPPPSVVNGGIIATRDWVRRQQLALAAVKAARSSVVQLEMALKNLKGEG